MNKPQIPPMAGRFMQLVQESVKAEVALLMEKIEQYKQEEEAADDDRSRTSALGRLTVCVKALASIRSMTVVMAAQAEAGAFSAILKQMPQGAKPDGDENAEAFLKRMRDQTRKPAG